MLHHRLRATPKGSGGGGQQYIAVGHIISPYITAYPWSSSTGFGTKYANPATLPISASGGVAFSPDGDALAVSFAASTSPRIYVYEWSAAGFGDLYTNPATVPPSTCYGVAFSPAGDYLAVAHASSPYVSVYPWSPSTGFGTRITAPVITPLSTGRGVAFNPDGDALAVASLSTTSTYRLLVYPWDAGFGTPAQPTVPGAAYAVAFSPAGDAVAVAHYNSPWITVFPWVDGATGTKYANPVGLAFDDSYAYSVAFSPDGAFIAIVNLLYSPYIWVYPWSPSTGFGTKVSNPATSLAGANAVAFSPDGDAIAVAEGGAGDRIAAYAWSSSGFGARYSAPGTLPANTTYVVAFGESA